MTTANDDDALATAIIQIAAQSERITDLDARETGHHRDVASRLEAVTSILGHHAAVIKTVDGLDRHVTAIADRLAELTEAGDPDSSAYQPAPAPRLWLASSTEREPATDRLRAWVEQVYQPGYGHLAAALPSCWEHHPLCLYTLDWLSELWSVLYLGPERAAPTLGAQAEWQTRLLPAAATQMAKEATNCQHRSRNLQNRPPATTRTQGPPPWPTSKRP